MSAAAAFTGDYSPGGLTTRAKRRRIARINGRKGGLASGRRRRQLGQSRAPRARSREEALALAYRHRQLTKDKFAELYAARFERPERPSAAIAWEKGLETLWTHYVSVFRRYRACGQHYGTTNEQRGDALCARGRPRCRRTIQRLNRRLEDLGLARVSHCRRGGARAGNCDYLVVEIRSPRISHVTLPLRGTINPPFGREVDGGAPGGLENTKGETALSPAASPPVPPDGGGPARREISHVTPPDSTPPPTADSAEREGVEAQIRFLELKLELDWGPVADIRDQLVALRGRLTRLGGVGHASP